jgi:hypothetical protein
VGGGKAIIFVLLLRFRHRTAIQGYVLSYLWTRDNVQCSLRIDQQSSNM